MDHHIDNVFVVIRAAGERTTALSEKLVIEQGVPRHNIAVIKEAPFSRAVKKCFELGIEKNLPWTLCNDADVLLRPNSIKTVLEFGEKEDNTVCELQGYILDKLFGGPRKGGIHLYRTSLLPKALAKIPAEGVDIRPEAHTLKAMNKDGYPWVNIPYIVGLHDYEQYYSDIFRKCFVQAHKHQHYTKLFVDVWREMAQQGDGEDFIVALKGFARGIEHYGDVFIDVRQDIFQDNMDELGITEKDELNLAQFNLDNIENVIRNWQAPLGYTNSYSNNIEYLKSTNNVQTYRQLLYQRYSKYGIFGFLAYMLGSVMSVCGTKIVSRVERCGGK